MATPSNAPQLLSLAQDEPITASEAAEAFNSILDNKQVLYSLPSSIYEDVH